MDKLGAYELNTVILGDCLAMMKGIPDNSIDTIITDPPYGLGNDPDIADLLHHWLNDEDYDTGPGFMSKDWDVIPGPSIWRECFRVMKPGGCLMAFGGTRTVDLLSIAIRMAGFEKFDEICWIHAQGFPKSTDISKKLDAMAGAEREVIGERPRLGDKKVYPRNANGDTVMVKDAFQADQLNSITAPATEAAKTWDGYGTSLKPAHEVILCFWKPREKSFAENALKWGVSGLNVDECRIEADEGILCHGMGQQFNGAKGDYDNKGRQYQNSGRFPANVILTHHESCVKRGRKQVRGSQGGYERKAQSLFVAKEHQVNNHGYADPDGLETVEDWQCHPDCPVFLLDQQAGVRKSGNGNKSHPQSNRYGGSSLLPSKTKGDGKYWAGDSGTASRFFYTAKAPGRERWFYCQICKDAYPYADREDHAHGKSKGKRKHQIAHPTVKPQALLDYLCKLTRMPTGGIVLDPFAGSGTTGEACINTGRQFLLIEKEAEYYKIAQRRIEQIMAKPKQLRLV